MSSFPVSTSLDVKKFGYVAESPSAPGTTPSNPAFKKLLAAEFTPSISINNVEQTALGSPYLHAIEKTGERYRCALNWTPFNGELLEYAINTSGTRHRGIPLTFGLSQDLNSAGTLVEQYMFAKGAQCDSVTISGSNDAVSVSSEWVALNLTNFSTTTGLTGTPTWETLDPATDIGWTGLSGGTDPITWNAAAQKVSAFSVTVNNAISEVQFMGDAQLSYATPTTHRNTVSMDIVYKDTTLFTDVKNLTKRTGKIKLATGWYITLTNCVLEAYDLTESASSTDAFIVSYSGKAVSATITTS